ncbi:MAG: hypothetical protein WKG06_35615 [Segetibacter sp.]
MKKLLLVILVFLSLMSLSYGQKIFKNKEYGFEIQETKRIGSKRVIKEVLKILEKIELSEENLEKIISDNKGSVLLTSFYKYNPKSHAGLIPTIQINVRAKIEKDFLLNLKI